MSDQHEITIPSTPTGRQEAEAQVMKLADELGFSEEAKFSIKLAIEEAIVNAMKHGNRFDKRKKVYIRYGGSGQTFTVTIRDEGHGFDRSTLPDPTSPENLALPYGRGVMLMEAYMDDVQFSVKGNEVTMVKENR